jgi:hypothetical protein
MVGVLTVVICAVVLTGCGCTARSCMTSQTASIKKVKKSTGLKPTLIPLSAALRSQNVNSKKPIRSTKFTESKSRPPIPLPATLLLSPQLEPDCEFETIDFNADERQKLDYERQCYRHAEIIVRSRLQLLQDSVDRTINAVKHSARSSP